VDDEEDICEILKYNLENEGYEVETANSAEEALTRTDLPDLMLLDVMMDGMSGFQLARKLKENAGTENIPIIFITALDDEDDMVRGLNLGADDYIAKPLSMKEVKARVNAVLRRAKASASNQNTNIIVYEEIAIDRDNKTASLDGTPLPLTKLEMELLTLFLQNPGRVFSREALLQKCWPQEVYVLERTVDVNITRLRKKIGRYGAFIRNRQGYGYCFSNL